MAVQDRSGVDLSSLTALEAAQYELLQAILSELMVQSHFLKEGLGVKDEVEVIRADKLFEVAALLGR